MQPDKLIFQSVLDVGQRWQLRGLRAETWQECEVHISICFSFPLIPMMGKTEEGLGSFCTHSGFLS